MDILLEGHDKLWSNECILNLGTQRPELPVNAHLSGVVQAVCDILDVRPFLPLLVPTVLHKFPHCGRKTHLGGVGRFRGTFTLHHHHMDIQICILWEGVSPGKNLTGMVRPQINGGNGDVVPRRRPSRRNRRPTSWWAASFRYFAVLQGFQVRPIVGCSRAMEWRRCSKWDRRLLKRSRSQKFAGVPRCRTKCFPDA